MYVCSLHTYTSDGCYMPPPCLRLFLAYAWAFVFLRPAFSISPLKKETYVHGNLCRTAQAFKPLAVDSSTCMHGWGKKLGPTRQLLLSVRVHWFLDGPGPLLRPDCLHQSERTSERRATPAIAKALLASNGNLTRSSSSGCPVGDTSKCGCLWHEDAWMNFAGLFACVLAFHQNFWAAWYLGEEWELVLCYNLESRGYIR